MNTPSGKKRPVILLAAVILILGVLTWVFYHKVSSMLDAETQQNLLSVSEHQSHAFEESLQAELAFLTGVAKLAGFNKDQVNWQHVREALVRSERSRFSESGAVNLYGKGVIGRDRQLGRYQGLQHAFRGYNTISVIESAADDDAPRFMLAAPVMHYSNIRFVIYGIIEQSRLQDMIAASRSDAPGMSMVVDEGGKVILPVSDPAMRDNIRRWRADPDRYGIADNIQSLYNKVRRYKKGIERLHISGPDGGDFYLDAVPMGINGWRFASLAPGKESRSRVESIAQLFLLVFGALLLLFVIVLAYLQINDSAYRSRLFSLAYVDRLTGLPNWEKLRQDLTNLYATEKARKDRMLVSFDIKGFKIFNEMFGYQRGDALLNHIAERLRSSIPGQKKLLCRYENDCFAYVVPRQDEEEAKRDIRMHLDEIAENEEFQQMRLQFSCGACVIPADGDRDWNSYMNAARIAREEAKKSPETCVAFFDDNLRSKIIHAQRLRGDMEDALANDDFLMYLQPKFAIAMKGHEKIAGAEALVRWRHRQQGMLPPNLFIPIFEEDGSIEKLDRFMFEKACRCLSRWLKKRRPVFPISVNLSRVQLSNPNLIRELTDIADAHGTPRRLIDIELTESASFGDMDTLLGTMRELKNCGFKLSLDDFGTGYSSLSLLRDMPMDVLKLDKSFINPLRHADADAKTLQFVRDIIRMADNLGIQTLAEGVETERQLDILRDVNCDIVQGYYFSKPVPVEEYEDLIASTGTKTYIVRRESVRRVR